jgi:hypothetical protein
MPPSFHPVGESWPPSFDGDDVRFELWGLPPPVGPGLRP